MHRPRLLGFFPKNILLVQDDLSGGVERVLNFNMLLHSAGAASVSQLFESKKTGVRRVCRNGSGGHAMQCSVGGGENVTFAHRRFRAQQPCYR